MATRYKITATIIRPGNLPVKWTRYSDRQMTRIECEKMLSVPKEAGRSSGETARVEDFTCKPQTSELVEKKL
ncbi:DUF1187 family protein [Escherichia coli]|uniref:DUF1187 family protein n=1 Tax=Escherichia coli TaxID=562 RepID=UPI000B7D4438|nr:DUF1187 family protein [Escherichia coli]EFN6818260.1 DUF1187 family protein [Escherichia coli O83:H15]EFC0622924.1 DUF1187 family protein [Escherichia coli]EFC0637177.1 DUF1187 family protein [Escherichia coli]EFC1447924.1 DUF1187 family protein [Escherichia coli]EFC1600268.1 DUF1187 family protein [Escherichia coli]